MEVWTVVFDNEGGLTTELYQTQEDRDKAIAEYVDEWWDEVAAHWEEDYEPEGQEKIDFYFDNHPESERCLPGHFILNGETWVEINRCA